MHGSTCLHLQDEKNRDRSTEVSAKVSSAFRSIEGLIMESNILEWRKKLYTRSTPLANVLILADTDNSVTDINVENMSLEREDCDLLAQWLEYNRWRTDFNRLQVSVWSNLASLSLKNCVLGHGECEIVLNAIAKTKTLRILDVSGNCLGGYADEDDYFVPTLRTGKALAKVIEANKNLTWLSAKYCHLGMRTMRSISSALEKNCTLTYLNVGSNTWWWDENTDELLSDQMFDSSGIKSLAAALCTFNQTLVYLELLSTGLYPLLVNGKGNGMGLTQEQSEGYTLSFRDHRLGRIDIIFIVECIKKNSRCKVVSFSGCVVEKQAAESLANMLEKNQIIESLDLTRVRSRHKDAMILARAALKSPGLKMFADIPMEKIRNNIIQSLMLNGVGIGPHGCIVLTQLLCAEQTSLTHLYLAKNEIGTFGAKAFEIAFSRNTTLEFIDLRGNMIEDAALENMARGLLNNPGIINLKTLDLQDNVIGGFGVSKRVDGLFSFADALVVHAQRHANNGLPSQLFIGGNALKHHIALSLRETYGESRLEVFVDVNNT